MPLNFDFRRVRDYEAVTTDPADPTRWNPVADALIWMSMICGYNEITEKNAEKVIERVMQYQLLTGAFLSGGKGENNTPKEIYIMPTDVRRFIGMTTNASKLTDAQWGRKVVLMTRDRAAILAAERRPSALDTVAMLHTPKVADAV